MGVFRRDKGVSEDVPVAVAPGDTVPIDRVRSRRPVRIVGQVSRVRTKPSRGIPSLCVQVSDGTGTVVALWTGRRSLGGVTLGRTIVIEGVAADTPEGPTFMNPSYELL